MFLFNHRFLKPIKSTLSSLFVLSFPFLFATLTLFLCPKIAYCYDSGFAWDANTEPDLAGYKIYYKNGVSGAPYNGIGAVEGNSPILIPVTSLSDPKNPVYTIHGLSDTETFSFVITAYDIYGNESGFSNELSYQPSLPHPSFPIANDDTATVAQDSGTSIVDVIKNDDFGADGPAAADITITSLPVNGSAAVNNGGTPNHPVDDSIDYTPSQNFTGTDTVTYKICDSNNDCDTVVLTVTVTNNSTPGKRNQFLYDEAGQRLQVLTDNDTGLSFIHVLPASSIGTFSIDFLPTIKHSMSGIMIIGPPPRPDKLL